MTADFFARYAGRATAVPTRAGICLELPAVLQRIGKDFPIRSKEAENGQSTGLEGYYTIKNNKKMRFGYTTGSCAAAAAKGAVEMLLENRQVERYSL